MKKLVTIQKRKKLNDVYIADKKGNGGANHKYLITSRKNEDVDKFSLEIQFQDGARNEKESIDGVLDTDLLEIVRHRLQCFQKGEFATKENEYALIYIEEALKWMNERVKNRLERNVLGLKEK